MEAEVWYCWREYVKVEGEKKKRLLVPWSDPHEYEYAADGLFYTKEEARKWKDECVDDNEGESTEHWILCKETIEPCEEF